MFKRMKRADKQETRLVKVVCGSCGYVLRTTRRWLNEIGTPICRCNNRPMKVDDPYNPLARDMHAPTRVLVPRRQLEKLLALTPRR